MDFSWSEDQAQLKELAAQVLSENSGDEQLRQFSETGQPYDAALWSLLAETGLLGLAIPEDCGGSGLGMTEIGLLLEEQGRTLAPVPVFATLVLAARPISLWGRQAQQEKWLGPIASGRIVATAALEERGNADPTRPKLKASRKGDGWVLDGEKPSVPYGNEADLIVISADFEDQGPAVVLVERSNPGLTIEAQRTTGSEPHARLTLKGLRVEAADILGDIAQGADIVRSIVNHARVGLAAMQIGVVESALRRTAQYTSERIQFGRPIGSMQAVQQRLADGYIDLEALRSTYLRAVWSLDLQNANDAEVAAAKYWAATAGHRVTHSAQHLHGGMGADITYPIHRYFLRARQIESALGGASLMTFAMGQAAAEGRSKALSGV